VEWALGIAKRRAQLLVGGGVFVVAVDITEQRRQPGEGGLVDAAVCFEALAGARAQLVEVPAGKRDADDWHVEAATFHQRLEGWEDLLVGQVAGSAEEDQRA